MAQSFYDWPILCLTSTENFSAFRIIAVTLWHSTFNLITYEMSGAPIRNMTKNHLDEQFPLLCQEVNVRFIGDDHFKIDFAFGSRLGMVKDPSPLNDNESQA